MNTDFDFSWSPTARDAALRAARVEIANAHRRTEPDALHALLAQARLSAAQHAQAQALGTELATRVRAARANAGGVDALMLEFALSSAEGVALMCLAEALLRIPDTATRDALIRDKLKVGNWQTHIGASPSLFVNATAWGLLATGTLINWHSENALARALVTLLRKGGEPLIRKAVNLALQLLGAQFVSGRTIEEALHGARSRVARGFTYSYDMLGEAALTQADAQRYYNAYEHAIHRIGAAGINHSAGALHTRPGISIKLSALHPRYTRAQATRVHAELVPRVAALARLAHRYDIGLNIDAEQADKLELSMDVFAALCSEPALAGWAGVGCVVQAYQKRARPLLDWLIALARGTNRKLMVRLVKGAYWDSEIKFAQVHGYADYPVFTRKVHTDVSYLACARAMLDAPDAIYPQFATHNAHTIGAIHALAGAARYEFQCLHGMGESVYDALRELAPTARCRIYAPVGPHETLLAYLVRRLLENGANSSFVNRIVDAEVSIETLMTDPVTRAVQGGVRRHAHIPLPSALFPGRKNSPGIDLADDAALRTLASALTNAPRQHHATPLLSSSMPGVERPGVERQTTLVVNPADHEEIAGSTVEATLADVATAVDAAVADGSQWSNMPAVDRARCLEQAADLLEVEAAEFIALAVREAGKTIANGLAEVREAIDFLRYYAVQTRIEPGTALGPCAAISPWNFPLAIFVGQIAAALAAGNPVLAKPAEQTPLIAYAAVSLLHRAGVPRAALQLLPGAGNRIGAALVRDTRIAAVLFTGSCSVAQWINRQLASRELRVNDAAPILIAETGGQNAMIVDSAALPEQVVADALLSAFDSAGQRCSALRLLCVQDDIAAPVFDMLIGAMQELRTGNPCQLATDLGPVIDAAARDRIVTHVARLRRLGLRIVQGERNDDCAKGTYVAPTLIDLVDVAGLRHLQGEVFGPVLHLLRWQRHELPALITAINATGYGLTHGIATRIDATLTTVLGGIRAGNIYVNRNLVGAVVGAQPFGGHGLSGTGPKAGGPLYLRRLLRDPTPWTTLTDIALPGPTGETNTLQFLPRGVIACVADDEARLIAQGLAAHRCGNRLVIQRAQLTATVQAALRGAVITAIDAIAPNIAPPNAVDAVLLDVAPDRARELRQAFAAVPGKIVPMITPNARGDYDFAQLIIERTLSINTAAMGGDAALLSLADD